MLKYDQLFQFLSRQKDEHLILTFTEIESIIGDKLPTSAYKYVAWWSNSRTKAHTYSHAWTDAGYHTTDVLSRIFQEKIEFIKA